MANFYLFPEIQFQDNTGAVLNGGLISTFAGGTVTPQATFTDSTGGTPNANPVVLDSAGRCQMWLSPLDYKFVIKTSGGATLATIDHYNPANINSTVSSLTDTGDLTLQQTTAATGGANQSSNNLKVQGRYWTGAADATDTWTLQDVIGAGSNPTSTLTITHSGSSGASKVSIPGDAAVGGNLAVTGNETVGGTLGVTGAATFSAAASLSNGTAGAPSLPFTNSSTTGLYRLSADNIGISAGGTGRVQINSSGIFLPAGEVLDWNSGTIGSAQDTGLSRTAAGEITAGNGTDQNSTGTFRAQLFKGSEAAAPSGSAGFDLLYPDSTAHRWKMNNNNGGADTVAGYTDFAASPTSTFKAPVRVAVVDLTAQNNNIGSTLLYAVPAAGAGFYRISIYEVVTTAAGVSSTMPNVTVAWTDNDTNTSSGAITVGAQSTTNTVGATNTVQGSSAAGILGASGCVINAKASTNINYSTINYASNAANAMQYALHIRVDYLGV